MCKILNQKSWGISPGNNMLSSFKSGEVVSLPERGVVNNLSSSLMKLSCEHKDGRKDSYDLLPGQSLVTDENDTKIILLNAAEIGPQIT